MPSTRKPTTRQLAYLKTLAQRTGQTFTYPKSIADASAEITRLKTVTPSSRTERRIEHKLIADQIRAGARDAARVREDELSGRGATATWAHTLERSTTDGTRSVARRPPSVGVRTELARYTIPAGERVLYGQRVDDVDRVTDRPAGSKGRSYLVERELETKGELDALVRDYLNVAADLGEVPAGHLPLDR
jgi:hypothetical protein